jgi:CRISPR/Cas system-associated endoribonuclease Cas2
MRIQRSIYYVEWQDISSLQEALQTAINILDQNEDDFRIYTIGGNTYALHSAVDIDNPCILL